MGADQRRPVSHSIEDLLQGPRADYLDGFVSHRLTLDEVNKGFELMEAQDGIRSVIRF